MLGLISTFNKLVPELSIKDKPIRDLGKKNAIFKCTVDHKTCLEEVKQAISDNILLEPYKPSANSIVFRDASISRVGYMFIQTTKDGKIKIIS